MHKFKTGKFGFRELTLTIVLVSAFALGIAYAQAVSNDYGTLTLTPDGNGMKFKFEPTNRVNCDKILLAQTVKFIFANGGDVVMKPGDIYDGWRYRDKSTTDGGTSIDHLATSEDPWFNGDDRDATQPGDAHSAAKEDWGEQGKRNASGSKASEWEDYPAMPDGFFPAGKTKYRMEAEICAMCAEGDQAGTVYGCTTWVFERAKGDPGQGTARHTGDNTLDPPSSQFTEAMDKWEENHINEAGARFCPD